MGRTETPHMQEFKLLIKSLLSRIESLKKYGLYGYDLAVKNRISASLDVVEDSQSAISHYKQLPKFSERGGDGGILYVYGLLQAMYMQQDALKFLLEDFGVCKNIDYKTDYPCIYDIRELRNDSIGHPTCRGGGKSYHYLAILTVCNRSFDMVSYNREDNYAPQCKNVDVGDIIKIQEEFLIQQIDAMNKILDERIAEHKNKFKEQSLMVLISGFRGEVRRLYDVTDSTQDDFDRHIAHVQNFAIDVLGDVLASVRNEMTARYGELNMHNGNGHLVIEAEYIYDRLKEWSESDTLFKNKDAGVFVYALDKKIEELEELFKEVDAEFAQ